MKIRKLLVLFLIPLALFFVSCENELQTTFIIELDSENPPEEELLNQIDYFKLTLFNYKYYVEDTIIEYVLEDEILKKNEILRLGDLEPGKYVLWVDAYNNGDEDNLSLIIDIKSDKMDNNGNLIIDDESPTIVTFVLRGMS